ncbi:hypothetical protein EDB19DRAFT_2041231 [Suillus lakei]|nr:hypothetical protein EDB19DRAFT_2041231 [Suillus lakei]
MDQWLLQIETSVVCQSSNSQHATLTDSTGPSPPAHPPLYVGPESPATVLGTSHPLIGGVSRKEIARAVDDGNEDLAFNLDHHRDGERGGDEERIGMEVRMLKEELSSSPPFTPSLSSPDTTQVPTPLPPPPLPLPSSVRVPLLHLGESRALFASVKDEDGAAEESRSVSIPRPGALGLAGALSDSRDLSLGITGSYNVTPSTTLHAMPPRNFAIGRYCSNDPRHAVLLYIDGASFVSSYLHFFLSGIAMATSAAFHGVVGLQNGSRYQIDKRITGDMMDSPPLQKTVSILLDARTTIGPFVQVDDDAHSLHLFANHDLQPLPDSARASRLSDGHHSRQSNLEAQIPSRELMISHCPLRYHQMAQREVIVGINSNIIFYTQAWTPIVVNAMLGVIMMTRIHAMYQGSTEMFIFLVVVLLVSTIASGVMTVIAKLGGSRTETVLLGYICGVEIDTDSIDLYLESLIPTAVWEILAFLLAVWIVIKHFRELRQSPAGSTIGDCFTVLINTHVIYFVVFAAVACFTLGGSFSNIMYSPSLETAVYCGVLDITQSLQMFVLGPRLILSVREYHAKVVARSDGGTRMTSIAFQAGGDVLTGGDNSTGGDV